MTPTTEDVVLVTVRVETTRERAFDVFTTKFGTWWPMQTHHIGSKDAVDAIIEPRVGGRWFERAADGTECEWGSVLAWDPPNRIVLAWHLNPAFAYDPDPALATEVEVRFVVEEPSVTRVELEHRGFAVHGDEGEGMRSAVGSDGGWTGLMKLYVEAASPAA